MYAIYGGGLRIKGEIGEEGDIFWIQLKSQNNLKF